MKKSIIAASAASIALAAMPVLGVFAEGDPTPTDDVTDTITITITPSCTFTAGGDDDEYGYEGTNAGGSVNLNNDDATPTNIHTFTVFCNNNSGYKVSATASALNQTPSISDNFAYKATLPTSSSTDTAKKDGAWNATIGQASGGSLSIDQLTDGGAATDIVTLNAASATGGETFTATYTAWIGTETPAGTYSGTIAYTLTPNA